MKVGVDELDRGGEEDGVRLLADRLGGRHGEHRADALAAGQQRVAHRGLEALGLGRRADEAQRLRVPLDVGP